MPSNRTPIRAVLFDLDDTLNDRTRSWRLYVRLLAEPLTGLLGPCDVDEAHRIVVAADRSGYRPKDELFGEMRDTLVWQGRPTAEQLEAHWRKHFAACTVTRDGVVDVLSEMRRCGLRLGIVSNGRADSQNAKIAAMGLQPMVDVVVISESAGFKKPDARIFDLALQGMQTGASATLFVGDNPTLDIYGAAQLGMRTAWLDTGRAYPGNIPRADHQFSAFTELLDVVGLTGASGV